MAHVHSAGETHEKPMRIVFVLTSVYLIAEVIGGVLTGSLALLADAGHMLTDVAGVGLALFAIRYARRPATPRRTYGYHRMEILAAVANAVVLLGISVYILVEAWQRFRHPPEVSSVPMMVVAGVGLVVNIVGIWLLRGGSSESLNVRGAYFEVMADLVSSIGVLIAGAIMLTTGWWYADPILSAGIGLFIVPRTLKLLQEAIGVLLEGTPPGVDMDDVRSTIASVPGVEGVHDLHVWTLTSGVHALSAHVVVAEDAKWGAILEAVQSVVTSKLPIHHATIQVEPPGAARHETHL